jgi:hypothetical protein
MPLGKDSLERQLATASANLDVHVKKLDEKGVAADQRKRDSIWRALESKVRSLKRRIIAVNAVAERDAECERRKEAAAAG